MAIEKDIEINGVTLGYWEVISLHLQPIIGHASFSVGGWLNADHFSAAPSAPLHVLTEENPSVEPQYEELYPLMDQWLTMANTRLNGGRVS